MSEDKGLSGWEHKSNEQKAKEVEVEFGDEVEYVEVEEEEEKKKMDEGELSNRVEKEADEKEELKKKQKKEETPEEKKERYIDVLVGIGFQRSKDKGDGKLRFYYKIDDNSAVGRTFDSRTPLGKFWCKQNGEFLKDCKDLEIVKRFYAIRDGSEEMPEKKEIPKKEEKEEVGTQEIVVRGELKPNAIVQDAQKKADELYAVVEKQHLYQPIKGKKYLQLEAWQVLGKFCNVTGEIEWVKPVEMWDARGFEARAVIKVVELTRDEEGNITTKVGDTIAVAESMCVNDEENWQGKPMFQLKSMSQTRALSKAYRSCLSFIVALAGYAATPAEEM